MADTSIEYSALDEDKNISQVVALTGPFCTERFHPKQKADDKTFGLASRLIQRFMCSETIGTLIVTLMSSGSVISSGVMMNHLDYKELTSGRLAIMALCNGLVSF